MDTGLDFHFLSSSPSAGSDEAGSAPHRRGTSSSSHASRPTTTPTSASAGGNSRSRRTTTAIDGRSIRDQVVIDSSPDTDSSDIDILLAESSRLLQPTTSRPTPRRNLSKSDRHAPSGSNGGLRLVDSNQSKAGTSGTTNGVGSTGSKGSKARPQPRLNLWGSKPRIAPAAPPVEPNCQGHDDASKCTSLLVRCTSVRPNGRMCANRYCLDYLEDHQLITDKLRNNHDEHQPGILSTAGMHWKCPPCNSSIEQSKRTEEAKRILSHLSNLSDLRLHPPGPQPTLPEWTRVSTELPYDNIMARVTVYQSLVRFQSFHPSLQMLRSLNPFKVWDHDTMDTILTLMVSTIIGISPTKLKSAPANLNIPNFPTQSTWRPPHHQRLNRIWSHFVLSYRRHKGDRRAQRTTSIAVGSGEAKGKKRTRTGKPLEDDPLNVTTSANLGTTGWVTEYELWDELARIISMYNVPIQPLMELQPPREPALAPTPSEREPSDGEEEQEAEAEDVKTPRNPRKRVRAQQDYNEQSEDDEDEWDEWERSHETHARHRSVGATMHTQAGSTAEEETSESELEEAEEDNQAQRRSSRLRRRPASTKPEPKPKGVRRSAPNQPYTCLTRSTARSSDQTHQDRTTRTSARATAAQPTGRTTRAVTRAAYQAITATPEPTSARRPTRWTTQTQVDSYSYSQFTSSSLSDSNPNPNSNSNANDSDSSLTDPGSDLEIQMVAGGSDGTPSAATEQGKGDAQVESDIQKKDLDTGSAHDTTLSSPPASDQAETSKTGTDLKVHEGSVDSQIWNHGSVEEAKDATAATQPKEAMEATATTASTPRPPGLERKISLLQSLFTVALQHPTLHEELRTFLDAQTLLEREERESIIETREKFVRTKLNPLMAQTQALHLITGRRAIAEGQEKLDRLYAKQRQLERNFKLTSNKNKLKMYRRKNAVNVRFESLGKDNEQREYWLFDSPSSDSALPVAKAEWSLGLYVYGKPLPMPPSVPSSNYVPTSDAHEAQEGHEGQAAQTAQEGQDENMVNGGHEASNPPSDPLTSLPLGPQYEGDGSTLSAAEDLGKDHADTQVSRHASAFAPLIDWASNSTREGPYAAEQDEPQEEEACWQVIDDAQGMSSSLGKYPNVEPY